jgi:chromate transporter
MSMPQSSDKNLPQPRPGLVTLFLAFTGVAIIGFGGVLPWARRMLVEQRRWMTPDDFTEAFSLSQFLPGGNIINLAVIVGQRFRGASGALMAVAGLLVAPVFIMVGLGMIYAHYGQFEAVHDALAGVAAGAAGLILAMAAKMAEPLIHRRAAVPIALAVLAFAGAGLVELPLILVVAVLAPVSIAIAWVAPR